MPGALRGHRESQRVLADHQGGEQFLSGRGDELTARLKAELSLLSERLEFEKAAELRDKIAALDTVLQKQKVLDSDKVDKDVVAVVKDERGSAIQMLYIRGGKLIGQRQFFLERSGDVPPTEAVQEFVKQYYAEAAEVPREVLLPVEIEERGIVEKFLRQKRGGAVTVEVPVGGEGLALVEMAATNAEQALRAMSEEVLRKEAWTEQAMSELQDALELPSPPARIEGFDISNVQGTAPVGSMVVAENASPAKGEYRRFKVRWHAETPNDFAMMKEVITRRLRAFLDGQEKFAKLPDLMLIDGGKGQLSAALEARDALGLAVPMVGLAKKLELLYVPQPRPALGGAPKDSGNSEINPPRADERVSAARSFREIELPLQSPGLVLLRMLRDEAHRFAISFHRKVRDKRLSGSVIEEIPGIGPRRKRLLLRTFGSIEAVRRASVDEIAAVPTLTRRLAEQVKEFLTEV
jgi:excinuclease ABC subunit C